MPQGSVEQGSARRLALPLVVCILGGSLLPACGDGEASTWVGVQDCAVGIPPESAPAAALTSAQLPLATAQVTPLGGGFAIRNFTLGPIGAFSCEAPQVTARFVAASASLQSLGEAPGPGRPLELVPFDCQGSDGRSYRLDGTGQGDQDALFFNQTFTAWLGNERATLVCSTRFLRQAGAAAVADAGVLQLQPAPFGPVPFGPAPSEAAP